jgi:hypothetical protein
MANGLALVNGVPAQSFCFSSRRKELNVVFLWIVGPCSSAGKLPAAKAGDPLLRLLKG